MPTERDACREAFESECQQRRLPIDRYSNKARFMAGAYKSVATDAAWAWWNAAWAASKSKGEGDDDGK